MYAMVIYENPLHLEIRLFTIFLIFELDECVLKAVAGSLVSNDFAGNDWPESAEDGV